VTDNPRTVSASMHLRAAGPAQLAIAVAVSSLYTPATEHFEVRQDGSALAATELADAAGSRLHVVDVTGGDIEIGYTATVPADAAAEARAEDTDVWRYLRPSRYCESDTLTPIARSEFVGAEPSELLGHVSSWVGTRLAYISGSSLPTDGAVRTLLNRRGVCRDYAHLVVALLRALDVPARVVSVYAPGLDPMDFHAVAEALVDGRWRVVDATTLAPRSTLVRIATGRDAADTAFLSTKGAEVELRELEVTATAQRLPDDDLRTLTSIL
jgi:transglutaminase-like putative cysteine protease